MEKQIKDLLKTSVIGKDFLKNTVHPTIDVFLDYRNSLKKKRFGSNFPNNWFDKEIKAVDEIIKILT